MNSLCIQDEHKMEEPPKSILKETGCCIPSADNDHDEDAKVANGLHLCRNQQIPDFPLLSTTTSSRHRRSTAIKFTTTLTTSSFSFPADSKKAAQEEVDQHDRCGRQHSLGNTVKEQWIKNCRFLNPFTRTYKVQCQNQF